MFVLFVEMRVKPGSEKALETTYSGVFRDAITAQPGFGAVELLRPKKADGAYRLCITFASRDLQQKWVATDLHGDVWTQMDAHCSDCSAAEYTTV